MACLNITNGLFLNNATLWDSGTTPVNTANGATITNVNGGGSPGCTVTKGASSEFFPRPLGGNVRFMVFGSPQNFVAVLLQSGGAGSETRSVIIVDVSGSTLATQSVLSISAPNTASLPAIDPSPGNGSVFMVIAPDGSGPLANVHASIHRSSNGNVLASAVPFHPTLQVLGNATPTQLQILEGAAVRGSGPRPAGLANVTTDPLNFPDAVLGAANPALAAPVRSAVIRNDGSDCLTITGVGNAGPYTVLSATPPFPVTLDPGQQVSVEIRLAPAAVGTFNLDLPINPAPSAGDTVVRCRGKARLATKSISFASTLAFGSVPLGASVTRNLVITNTGEASVNLSVPSVPIPGAEFALVASGFTGSLAPTAATAPIPIAFAPLVEGAVTRQLSFTSDATGSPHSVTLSGSGCVARAGIQVFVPPGPNIGFGPVQRGFRTVRVVRVVNSGNGPLSFRARTAGNALFRLQRIGDSITSPLPELNLVVNPAAACGALPLGSGELRFAVTFFADATPGLQSGQLVVDNHNAPGAPASFSFALEAEVIAAINADVEIVIDRSGSMSDSAGPRRKVDVAMDAARLFVQLARPDVDDRVGASRFNTVPEQVQVIDAITSANQAALVGGFVETSYAPAGGTAIAGGVLQAVRDLNAHPRAVPPPSLNKAIVVLTDANDNTPYLNPDDNQRYTLLGENGTVAVPVPADVRLYGVGIGDAVDTGRLAQLCPATAGQFLHVHDFSGLDFFKLEKHFTQIYMASVDLAQISDPTYWIQHGQTHEHAFEVLRGDVTIMVVIFDRDQVRLPFWLKTPLGELIELASVPPGFQIRPGISSTARFIEVRMPQGEPDRYAGTWKVLIRHDGRLCTAPGRPAAAAWRDTGAVNGPPTAAVEAPAFGFSSTRCKLGVTDPVMYGIALGAGSNFRLQPFVEPGVVRVGEPIRLNALVNEFGLPVANCVVTVQARSPVGTLSSLTLADDGAHQDGNAGDGDHGGSFLHTHQEGMYEFLFRAVGTSSDREPVQREATLSKYVEGRTPLVPPGNGDGQGDGPGRGPRDPDACCHKVERWMPVFLVLLALAVVLLLLMLLRR
jgi:hypothetical protein